MREPLEQIYGADMVAELWAGFVDGFPNAFGPDGARMTDDDLKRIKAQVLIVHGGKDQLVSKDHPPFMQKMIANTE